MRRLVCIAALLTLAGCDQLPFPSPGKNLDLAEKARSRGEYIEAVRLYETCLDGTKNSAEIHAKLARLYEKDLKDPIGALHHYRRCLRMGAEGRLAAEAQSAIARLDRKPTSSQPATTSPKTRALKTAATPAPPSPSSTPVPVDRQGLSTNPVTRAAEVHAVKDTRTYVVQPGDTLYRIATKFYGDGTRWKDIADANYNQLGGSTDLKPGQTLIIPE